ncbi:DUF3558 family protein [Amycolatopsis sp. GM8]|uniref:DUF3558 family protein n=1 Tax=Amycolatopsis sp. GM8 TaxID=2896530 RepID=UPI001F2A81FA|nr:DUF3558 family protein [Amycolatopsis sp. GM8]
MPTLKNTSLFATAALGLALMSGCSSEQPGQPVPSTGGTSISQTSSANASTGQDETLAAIKPCDLLTAQEAAQFKAQGPGQVGDTQASGSTSACGWHGRTADDNSVSFGVDIRATQGIDELRANGGTVTDGKVNSHAARQLQTVNGGCILSLRVGPKSRVDISVVADNAAQSCQIASDIANIIEPKLPPEAN